MLKDQVALVTGASRGIGRQIALALAAAGARIGINYCANGDAAHALKSEIIAANGEAEVWQADISDFQQAEAMVALVKARWERLDILVNNAGVTQDGLLLRMSENDWDKVLATNLKGCFNCCKAVLPWLVRARKGRIINLSSVAGLRGNAGQTNYAAAKAGVIGFTKALAKEVGSRNITVNAVAPGYIETDMTKALTPELRNQLLSHVPLNRPGTVADVAGLVAFLAGPQAAYITGQVIAVDGGMSM